MHIILLISISLAIVGFCVMIYGFLVDNDTCKGFGLLSIVVIGVLGFGMCCGIIPVKTYSIVMDETNSDYIKGDYVYHIDFHAYVNNEYLDKTFKIQKKLEYDRLSSGSKAVLVFDVNSYNNILNTSVKCKVEKNIPTDIDNISAK